MCPEGIKSGEMRGNEIDPGVKEMGLCAAKSILLKSLLAQEDTDFMSIHVSCSGFPVE